MTTKFPESNDPNDPLWRLAQDSSRFFADTSTAMRELQSLHSVGRSPTDTEEVEPAEYFSAEELEPQDQEELPWEK